MTSARLRMRGLFLAVGLGLVTVSGAKADVDVTGPWFVAWEVSPTLTGRLQFAQTGERLDITGTLGFMDIATSGRVDAAGAFATAGSAWEVFFCSSVTLTGTVAPDGLSFAAKVLCDGGDSYFKNIIGSRCGNGVVAGGEECDDGNRTDGDCCSVACRFEPLGDRCELDNQCAVSVCDGLGTCEPGYRSGSCDDGNTCTLDDACVDGRCTGTAQPDGTPCDDGDACTVNDTCRLGGLCARFEPERVLCDDLCDSCRSRDGVCRADPFAVGSKICTRVDAGHVRLADAPGAGADRLRARWRWAGGRSDQFGSPEGARYAVCVYAPYDTVASARIEPGDTCNGASCWRQTHSGHQYTSALGPVRRLRMSASAAWTRIDVDAVAPGFLVRALPLAIPEHAMITLRSSTGECWTVLTPETVVNTTRRFVARQPQP